MGVLQPVEYQCYNAARVGIFAHPRCVFVLIVKELRMLLLFSL